MAEINKDALIELNNEYLSLKSEYSRLGKIKTLFRTVRKGTFFETLKIKLNRKKYYDNIKKKDVSIEELKTDTFFKPRIAVYMCVVGAYDRINEPVVLLENAEYFIITDATIPVSSKWKTIKIDMSKFEGYTAPQINRYYKLHPQEVFSEFDYTVYLDGNIRIISDFTDIIFTMYRRDIDYALFQHPDRDCIYTESNYLLALTRFKKDWDSIKKQIIKYIAEGYPIHNGLYENGILFRKNSKKVSDLMECWWDELNRSSFRDQISFPYVLWKQGWDDSDIMIIGNDLKNSCYFRYYAHM